MSYMVVSLITNTNLPLESVCLDLFGIVLGIVLKYILENVMNDFPYVTLQKKKTELLDYFLFKLLILEAYGEITQYKLCN